MSARVFFISKDIKFDIRAASSFGESVFLFDRAPDPFNIDKIVREIRERLLSNQFDSSKDYVAITGPSTLLCVMTAMCVSLYESVSVLLWDARFDRYKVRALSLKTMIDARGASKR